MGSKSAKPKKKDAKVLLEEEIKFLIEHTTFTRDQIIDWHRKFLIDCPKGELDKKKFTAVYQEYFPRPQVEKFSGEVFKLFDTDKSGKIDFSEFLIAISTSDSGEVKKKLQLAFALYDSNHNGRLTKKELIKMLNAMYDLKGLENRKGDNDPKERADAIFRKMDTNYSNTLSEDEFVNGCLSDPFLSKLLNPMSN